MTRIKVVAVLAVLLLALTACGSDASNSADVTEPDETHTDDTHDDDDDHDDADTHADDDHDENFAFGESADAADADRTIEVSMLDTMRFDPGEFEVAVGETVTFSITNTGAIAHDFTLGDETTQDAHEQEMAEMSEGDHAGADLNAVLVQPGETEELTWTFTTAGELLIGCHVPGHYNAGMVAPLPVTG